MPSTRINRTYEGAETFGSVHKDLFALDGTSFGLSADRSAAFGVEFDAFVAARARSLRLRADQKATDLATRTAFNAFMAGANNDLKTIDAYAAARPTAAAKAQVYENAKVDPPAAASPKPAPATPTAATATLTAEGAVRLSWKGSVNGVLFVVRRALTDASGQQGSYERLPWTGPGPMVDATVPAGTRSVLYGVKALRAKLESPWSEPAGLLFTADAGAAASSLKIAA